ncbi:MAG: Mur ligase family protein, partial [Candidatus ainarchaeum sp.]|nr:Mur ligase family protein [Candidatus ainarchaeum sp.]
MNQEAEKFLLELSEKGILLGLERINSFLDFLGNPQNNFKSIHVAGTNGKGSTCAMIERILREAGFKTGIYTKPHLVSLNERFRINSIKIPEKELEERILNLKKIISEKNFQLSYFEFLIALAFQYFSDKKVDFAVIETGMGGRLDATNVLQPLVSIITNIALEHMQYLGNSLEKIAFEKAGIIKENGILLTTEKNNKILKIFKKSCKEKNSLFIAIKKPYKKSKVGLLGEHQF